MSASLFIEMSTIELTVSNLPIRKLSYGSNQRSKLVGNITLKNGSYHCIFKEINSDIKILCLSEANNYSY